ncbi:hypothetical protein PF005_g22827, partial [Phytophthora fragariae]
MASSFPMGVVDPSKVMEFLGGLPEEQQDDLLNQVMREFDEPAEVSNPQEELIQRFKEMRATFVRPGGIFAERNIKAGSAYVKFTIDDAKPACVTRSLGRLTPMIAKELDLGTTHRGRYLCGWVAVDDAFSGISATSLLLEDVTGYLVEIAVYGLGDPSLPSYQRQSLMASRFPKGKPIVVFEPFYKIRLDGSLGIRVEEPTEIAPWQAVPTDLKTWKNLGNKFFSGLRSQNAACGALSCYERALQTVQPEAHSIAVLLNNIATCRFKLGDYSASIQLSGAAVHLNPCYFKGWLRLASALSEREVDNQGEAKVHDGVLVESVVAHTRKSLPDLTAQQDKLLENTLKHRALSSIAIPESSLKSYAKWCVSVTFPALVITEENVVGEKKDADAWRKLGSEKFGEEDYHAAEEFYRKGLASSLQCCCDVSLVLNNIAAVYLSLSRESGSAAGVSVGPRSDEIMPYPEAALLNCTVAGIVDPINYKAWSRRARCLDSLGFSEEECVADLESIRSNVESRALLAPSERVNEFDRGINADIQRRSKLSGDAKAVPQVSEVPTHIQREQRDAMRPETFSAAAWKQNPTKEDMFADMMNGETTDIDVYIAQMESFMNMSRFAYAASRSNQRQLPREMMMFLKHSPPQIHAEFPKHRGWPAGIDPVFARKVLYRAYLDACANPWVKALAMRDGTFFDMTNPADMIKRWHGTAAFQILREKSGSLRYGDIIDYREVQSDVFPAYDARIRSNFANNPNRPEVYIFGTTHIAIGFNDFSSLLAATLRDEVNTGMPLQFVGFEMSEFAVAKCKVVAQMLGSPNVSISSVMEVWLSSTWSDTTLKDFRKSVDEVLNKSARTQNENSKVLSYLKHWASKDPISSAKAQSEFFSTLEKYNQKTVSVLCSFRREIDRLDLVQYILTGEVRASPSVLDILQQEKVATANTEETGSKLSASKKKRNRKKKRTGPVPTSAPLVGSLTMWSVPPGAPPLEKVVAFNTVDFMNLLDAYAEREKHKKNSAEKLSVVDLFVIHILRNLQRLRDLMLANKLTIEVHYGVVKAVRGEGANDPENKKLLERIAAFRPYTISWSNVLDYFTPEDFHDLARRCSMHGDCLHYGYSMNWSTQVFGASIMDYDPEHDKSLIEMVLDSALGFQTESQMQSSMADMFKLSGLDKLLHVPFRDNPLNSTGYVLAAGYKRKWVDHFMKKGGLTMQSVERLGELCTRSNCGLQQGEMAMGMPSPLYRTSLTLYMSWCYDPTLRLQPANDPFAVGAATDTAMVTELMK